MTTAGATSSSAPAAARSWPTSSACPCSAQLPLVPALREGGDEGRPITAVDPESEAAERFLRMAERVAVELAPRKVFSPQLRIN